MRAGVASEKIQFTKKEDAGLVSRLYQEGFVKSVNRAALGGRVLDFRKLGWGDEEGAVLVEALRYAAEHCAFPRGAVAVAVSAGNRIQSAGPGGDGREPPSSSKVLTETMRRDKTRETRDYDTPVL